MNFRISVSAEHVRTIKDPNSENVRIVHALVNVNNLPKEIPLDPDPRRPKINGAVTKRISASLATNNGRFHLLNRGITISVKHYEFDNKREILTLVIPPDDEKYGIIDGGHTYYSIIKTVADAREEEPDEAEQPGGQNSDPFEDQFVHIEILERVENYLADIAEARNFSIQLKNWTLANYRDKFDWLLDALGRDYADRTIKVSENDEQPVGILDVIQILGAVNPILFPDEKPAQDAYKTAGKILTAFIDDDDRYGFKKMGNVARDVLHLYDYVRANFAKMYNAPDDVGERGRFGSRKETKEMKAKKGSRSKATYYFLDPLSGPVQGEVPIDKGLAIPLISGFRVLLEERDGMLEWLTDPIELFDKYGTKLVRTIMNASDNSGNDTFVVGRDPQVYRQMTDSIRRWFLEGERTKYLDVEPERVSSTTN